MSNSNNDNRYKSWHADYTPIPRKDGKKEGKEKEEEEEEGACCRSINFHNHEMGAAIRH